MTKWKVVQHHAIHTRSHNNGKKVTAVVSIEAVGKDLKEPTIGATLYQDPKIRSRK